MKDNNENNNKPQTGVSSLHRDTPLTDSEFTEKLNRAILNKFAFNLDSTANGYYLADCRKNPPKRINAKPFRSLDQALDYIGGRIRMEFDNNVVMFKKLSKFGVR